MNGYGLMGRGLRMQQGRRALAGAHAGVALGASSSKRELLVPQAGLVGSLHLQAKRSVVQDQRTKLSHLGNSPAPPIAPSSGVNHGRARIQQTTGGHA